MKKSLLLLSLILLLSVTALAESQNTVSVSFLGPEGTYTEEAAQFWFHSGETLIPKNTVGEAVDDLLTGVSDFAVIPQENTMGGAVVNYVDTLIKSENAYVVGEVILPISQTLMGVPGAKLSDIRTVCSHAQGLTQSAQWRAENLPDAAAEEMPSTAAAASYVAEQGDRSVAAVAAPGAASLYGLEVLAENIQITDTNKTRFYILSRVLTEDERLPRAVFVVTCEGNQIAGIITEIDEAGLELVALHDRPEGSQLGRYHYVIEVEDETGISDEQISRITANEGVRFAGRFRSVEKSPAEIPVSALSHPGYTLDRAVILSRHNIRSPLSGGDSLLGTITPHEWFDWSSDPSELSLRGGILETEMGQFFRKWLEAEGLFSENFQPEGSAVRIYANSKQRTIATARYFAAGLLPSANFEIEFHMDFDQMDPVFEPKLTFLSDSYREYAEAQLYALFSGKISGLADNYALITDVIDMDDSQAFLEGTVGYFNVDDTVFLLELDAEPKISGSLKTACSVSDALVLQYYEEPNTVKAAFGHDLTLAQWKDISEIKDVYVDVLFTAPLISVNVAHPLLQEIQSEMMAEGRVFTFLCGHDSNLASVLAALDAAEYELPDAIEKKTPIGSKLVFSKWLTPDGDAFWSLDIVYQDPDQLRNVSLLDMEKHPAFYHIVLNGMEQNSDGLYAEEDLLERFGQAIRAYDSLIEDFTDSVPAEYEPAEALSETD